MTFFISFSKKLFTTNLNDYQTIGSINAPNDTLYRTIFKPLQITCLLRRINLIDSNLDLLENENDIDKMIEHPNIIEMFVSFIQNDMLYTIFPYSEYSSVDILCKPFGLEEKVILFILQDILKAVDYLHRNNIVHRAIKGSHVLIFGHWKTSIKFVLSGLKYSCHVDTVDELKLFKYPKNASSLLTSLAPEVLEQNILGYTFKSDIYSLGILCCELANGVVPFDNMSSDELLFYKIIGDIPKPLDSSCEEMNIFNELMDRLELTLKRRYQVYRQRTFSSIFHDFTQKCLHLEPVRRPTAMNLLEHPFISRNKEQDNNLIQKRDEILKEFFSSKF
uniref:STE20-related kinase adapter protein alpha-like n=1 Tax=Dermatophagoides pteronyssinus TaxID=6956 RepID=A0A6P6YIJ1_DERPT|nr:STE20-related kinase adapter protein alpha-like [Dermatophagoides pteronyssinus]